MQCFHVAPANSLELSVAACTQQMIELQGTPGIFGKKKTIRSKKPGEMWLCRNACEKELSSPDARGTCVSQLEDVGANSLRQAWTKPSIQKKKGADWFCLSSGQTTLEGWLCLKARHVTGKGVFRGQL